MFNDHFTCNKSGKFLIIEGLNDVFSIFKIMLDFLYGTHFDLEIATSICIRIILMQWIHLGSGVELKYVKNRFFFC